MFIKLSKISKTFKLEPLFEDISLTFGINDKIGIVGRNGTGKSTLLKIISGTIQPDSGSIQIESKFYPLYFTQQTEVIEENLTIEEYFFKLNNQQDLYKRFKSFENNPDDLEILSLYEEGDCYNFANSIPKYLDELGLGYLSTFSLVKNLSGGEMTRLRLAPLIFKSFEILLLDEPTNNLDIDSITWLENFLYEFEGILLVVSHDRKFLNNVVNKVMEIEDLTVQLFPGNYSAYKDLKIAQTKNIQNKVEVQKKHVRKIEKQIHSKLSSANYLDKKFTSANPYIMKKSGKKAKQAQILQKRLEREIEESDLHVTTKKWDIDFEFQPRIESSNNVVKLKNISKSFGDKVLFKNLNLEINRGDRVLIQGKNGSGKSTLLKIISGKLNPDIKRCDSRLDRESSILYGDQVEIGYFNQEDSYKSCGNTVIDEFMKYWSESKGDARTFLHKMLFKADDVFVKVSSLSPGERAKFKLATILAKSPNLLILDEPTNNLDIDSREQLEKALGKYTGTLIVISHDRYFVEKLKFDKVVNL